MRGTGKPVRTVAFYMDADAWPGGAELWLTHLIMGLRDAGWEVSLFLTDKRVTDTWASLLSKEGVDVTRVRGMREVDRAAASEAARALRGFPLVHVNKTHPRACLPAIAGARRAGARALVLSEHVVLPARSRYPLGASVVRRLVARANAAADLITVPSDASRRQYVEAYGPDPDKVVTVRGAVELSLYGEAVDTAAVRRSLGAPEEGPVGAVVSRLDRGKGVETAFRAVPLIRERLPDFRLVVVGTGALAGELEELRDRLGLADVVTMVGSRDDVPSVLSAVDVLLVPSESETGGLTSMEAGAASTPVVATNVGGLPEVVRSGETGLLVPPRDERALAEAAVRILTDVGLSRRMGRAGRELAERDFSRERLVEDVISLYGRVLGAEM
ncbi:MAG: glycosyltransferase [Candidatus Eisenbacteria bacterium]|nr:glycosyltransferase [Candidatus Eisenbacteria bacterium]